MLATKMLELSELGINTAICKLVGSKSGENEDQKVKFQSAKSSNTIPSVLPVWVKRFRRLYYSRIICDCLMIG